MSAVAVRQAPLIPQMSPIYSVSFKDRSRLPHGVREDLAQGMRAAVAIDGERVHNDFNAVNFYYRPICNGTWNATTRAWENIVFKEEPNFTWTPTEPYREVLYRCMPFYYRLDMSGDSAPSHVSVSAYPLEGFRLAPMFKNGSDYVYRPAFEMAVDANDGLPHSRAGMTLQSGAGLSLMNTLLKYDERACSERYADYFSDLLLMWVEFATRDLCGVMSGARRLNIAVSADYDSDASLETSVLRVSATDAANLGEGMAVLVKSASGKSLITGTALIDSLVADGEGSTKVVLDSAIDTSLLSIDSAGNYEGVKLTTQLWRTGSILPQLVSTSGSRKTLHSDIYPCAWRGKENAWGNSASLILDIRANVNKMYFLPDATAWSHTLDSAWVPLNSVTRVLGGFVVSFAKVTEHPDMMMPNAVTTTNGGEFYARFAWGTRGSNFYLFNGGFALAMDTANPATLQFMPDTNTYGCGTRLILRTEGD